MKIFAIFVHGLYRGTIEARSRAQALALARERWQLTTNAIDAVRRR